MYVDLLPGIYIAKNEISNEMIRMKIMKSL